MLITSSFKFITYQEFHEQYIVTSNCDLHIYMCLKLNNREITVFLFKLGSEAQNLEKKAQAVLKILEKCKLNFY